VSHPSFLVSVVQLEFHFVVEELLFAVTVGQPNPNLRLLGHLIVGLFYLIRLDCCVLQSNKVAVALCFPCEGNWIQSNPHAPL
jgi:hypothetical protein